MEDGRSSLDDVGFDDLLCCSEDDEPDGRLHTSFDLSVSLEVGTQGFELVHRAPLKKVRQMARGPFMDPSFSEKIPCDIFCWTLQIEQTFFINGKKGF